MALRLISVSDLPFMPSALHPVLVAKKRHRERHQNATLSCFGSDHFATTTQKDALAQFHHYTTRSKKLAFTNIIAVSVYAVSVTSREDICSSV